MTQQYEITLQARPRGCHLVTSEIMRAIPELPETGLMNIFVCHTSCALSINENCDPDVRSDMSHTLDRMVPEGNYYDHADEGPDDMPAHVKSSLMGVSLTIPIGHSRPLLGTWQGIYLCEFRTYGGPRRVVVTIVS